MKSNHSKKTGFFAPLLVLPFFVLGAFSVCDAQTANKYPPMGKLVDAGGHQLHMNITGKGGPAVIMENGSGDFSFIWSLVQPGVSKFTTAVSYDRAGFAWSEPGPFPRTGHQIAAELHTALHNAGIKGPYILVGQSFGGFLVRYFAKYYPDEVAGMVLVEALNEDSRIIINDKAVRIREMTQGRKVPKPQVWFKNNGKDDGKKDSIVMINEIEPPLDKLPDSIQKRQIWAQNQPEYRKAYGSEMDWSPEEVQDLYLNKGKPGYTLGNKPLIVLTRGDGGYNGRVDSAEMENERLMLQEDLTHLSTNSKHLIDKNSGHNIHIEDPAFVIDAIRQVYDAVVNRSKLK
ncbi:MAG TPA: alpha/beta hydrolase [Mucilaginibacter sp.]|jgi:pimeloyl-ACP methyl ester carboxylesterase